MTVIPLYHYLVEFHDGPLDGQTLPIYDKTLNQPGWRHGIFSRREHGNGGVIWSYAHRWPLNCPRYVLTPGDPNIATYRKITKVEADQGEMEEALWRGWQRALYPLSYAGDAAYFARRAAEMRGVDDPATLDLVADQAVVAIRNGERGSLGSYCRGQAIPDEVRYVCDMRGNLHVRVDPGRSTWFQPGPDQYAAYPDRYEWIPPIRYTSALLAKGPLTVIEDTLVTPVYESKLDGLRTAAVRNHAESKKFVTT